MNVLKTISRIKWSSFWQLITLCIPNFLFLWPTYRATKQCMQLSTDYFGRKHYQNGQANAFRHALWNVLISMHCAEMTKVTEKAIHWSKKITDWHEEAFFSKELPMKMDYHNNRAGRILFAENREWSQDQFIKHLLGMTANAIKIDNSTNLNQLKNQLVYLTDDH